MLLNRSCWRSGVLFGLLSNRQGIGLIAAAGLIGFVFLFTWFGGHFPDSPGHDEYASEIGKVSRTVPDRMQDSHSTLRVVTANQVIENGLDLSHYQRKWNDSLVSTSDDNSKFFNHLGLATAMAIKGYSREAISLICEAYGPGKRRCELIAMVFRSAKDLNMAGPIYKSLEFGDELNAACEGIGWQLSLSETPDKVDLVKFSFLGDRLDTMLATFAERFVIQHLNSNSEEVSTVFGDAFDLPLSKESARITLLKLYEFVPFDSWDKLSGGEIKLSGEERQRVLARMFSMDSAKAMEKIVSSNVEEADIAGGFRQWLAMDAAKPIDWLQNNHANLTASQKDHAMQGIAEYSATQGDCDVAWQWVGQIADPELKKRAESKVWSMERDIVRREISKNPEVVMQSMIAGDSRHQDYWIAEAMGTWVAKDPAKAGEWYQSNWTLLPANKSQYVAAAYANEALKRGDATTASQWAAYIQDPKTKQRIQDEINKAAVNAGN